jgi:hypothetical protein
MLLFNVKFNLIKIIKKIVGVQSRNKCSLWNVERKEWAATPPPPPSHTPHTLVMLRALAVRTFIDSNNKRQLMEFSENLSR